MIQETRGGMVHDPAASSWWAALCRLPQPLHLLEFVTGSQHYHFGCFEKPDEAPREAQDRMGLWGTGLFEARSSTSAAAWAVRAGCSPSAASTWWRWIHAPRRSTTRATARAPQLAPCRAT